MNDNIYNYASNPHQPRSEKKPRIIAAIAGLVTIAMLSFTSVSPASAAVTTVALKTAGNYSVLAGTTVNKVGTSIVGKIGISPGLSITGLPLINGILSSDTKFAAQAQADLALAYADADRRPTTATVSAQLAGQQLTAGVYQSDTGTFNLDGTLTLNGQNNPNSVFILEADALRTGAASQVKLTNGAQACNVFFLVKGSATLGSNSLFAGTVLALNSITAEAKAKIEGRLLARNGEVSLNANLFTAPGCNKAVASASLATGRITPPVAKPNTTSPLLTTERSDDSRVNGLSVGVPALAPVEPVPVPVAPAPPVAPEAAPVPAETPASPASSEPAAVAPNDETGGNVSSTGVVDSEPAFASGNDIGSEAAVGEAPTASQEELSQTGVGKWIPLATAAGLILLLAGAVALFLNRHRLPQG